MDDLISKLSEIRSEYNCFSADEEPYYRALSEAIKILSQLADGDTISRQAALKELAVYIHLIDKTMGKGILTDDDCMEAAKSVLGEDEIPAVQPATNCSEIPNGSDDTISRRAAIDALSEYATFWMSYTDDMSASDIAQEAINSAKDTMIRILKEQPTVQPETATVTIGRTRGGVVMWYECDACGESIDQKDCYCRNCGRKLTLPEPYKGGETE